MVIPQFLCEFWAENLPHGIRTQNRLNAADSNAEKPGLWPGFSTLRLVMVCDPIHDRQIERRAFERIAGDVSRLGRSEYQKAPEVKNSMAVDSDAKMSKLLFAFPLKAMEKAVYSLA
jgi:hypothetical protein